MADRVVPVDVRATVIAWPADAPRGAVARFCRDQGVSRSWFYELRQRALTEPAVSAMQPRPRQRPARHRQAIAVAVEELAVKIRKELADEGLDHGPVTVRYQLQQLGIIKAPAASTLARVFSRRGMVIPQPQKRPRSANRRFAFGQVHECWQLDAFEWPLADGERCVVFQLLDDCSRFLIASLVAPGETVAAALAVVEQGIAAFQVPCLVLTDNGTAFNQDRRARTTQLSARLRALGCRPISGRPAHPQTQGKDERVHQTLQRWLRAHPAAADTTELQALIARFDHTYNDQRPHQSLGMRTPADALRAGPIAIPPIPPEQPSPAPAPRAVTRRVGSNGKVSISRRLIQLGREHANSSVTVVTSGATVNIFNSRGEHLRSETLIPGKTYYSNGRPRSYRTPKTKRPH